MTAWHRLGSKDEILARVPFAEKIERHRIAVFLYEGRLTAISDICNHKGGPLSEGRLHGEFVTCPWHGSQFRLSDGACMHGPATFPQLRLEARLSNGMVEVRGREG